ncbi:uncharacterized protein UV8b_06177 [Ustilaginoidea virens]|uniref:DUF866 domain protein n=1 Tax=Ustilaginoidea virens TaxID=1159556 RepID=A0A1B5L298_USTVR|nr:uncharacterized protein UV8b_06177 [Ustilaginoidea virens]QUC21936.1 hypothetical protein UV8b_06177 [Ustilaginoidea virens]GAO16545.1 hypothetical protein UVI_02023720 [Ustilaginoidea virens]
MASQHISAGIAYLTDAAHLLYQTAPETSAHLMKQRNDLMLRNGLAQHPVQRQHVCGACGHIMIPGLGTSTTSLKLEARKSRRGGKEAATNKEQDGSAERGGPTQVITCGLCTRVTRTELPAPEPVVRRKAGRPSSTPANKAGPSDRKMTANASTKKRARSRKGGLQALLAGQQQKSTSSLSLADFMA